MHADHRRSAANFEEAISDARAVHMAVAPDEEAGSINQVLVAALSVQCRMIDLLNAVPEEGTIDDAVRTSRNNLLKTFDALLADIKQRPDLTERRDIMMIENALRVVHLSLARIALLSAAPANGRQESIAD